MKAKLIIFLLHAFSHLPLSLAHRVGSALAWALMRVQNRARATTQTNLAFCYPQLSEAQLQLRTQASLAETAKLATEMGRVWTKPIDEVRALIQGVQGQELMDAAKRDGKGVIIIAPHLGNWEVLGAYLSTQMQMTNLYEPPHEPLLDAFIHQARSRDGSELVPTNRKGIVALIKALKAKNATGILPDQEPLTDGGVFAPFFGQQALTMTLLPGLLKRSGAVVLAAFAKRLPNGQGFEVIIEAVDEAIYDADEVVAATAMNAAVESLISHAPDQYQWEYKRFKRQPDKKVIYQAGI